MKVGRTVQALCRRGIDARLVDPVSERLADFELVHLFAGYNGNHRIVEQAKADGLPVVMSTILNPPFSRWEGLRARWLSRALGRLTNWKIKTSYDQLVAGLELADHLVVLGGIERQMLIEGYGMPGAKITTVHNGIGAEFFGAGPELFLRQFPIPRPFVLHTGLVGEVKNQLGLVRALKGVDLDIVLVGYAGEAAKPYLQACIDEGAGRVHYLGELPHGELIASACAASAVVAIPSRHEGMPNSVLEALAADRPVVLTNNHTMDFRFPTDVAQEVAPDDHGAIRAAVMKFSQRAPEPGRARDTVAHMSWDAVAEQLAAIYGRVLGPAATEGMVR